MAIKYEEKYVCYIDILGFRDIIEKNLLTPQKIYGIVDETIKTATQNYVHDVISEIHQNSSNAIKELFGNYDTFYFSDTVVVLFDDAIFIAQLIKIHSELLKKKILVRGALTYGEVHYDKEKNILFGPAFIKAHDLEKQAIYPRIIIDNAAYTEAHKDRFTAERHVIDLDFDGYYTLFTIDDKDIDNFIKESLEKYKDNPKIYSKYYYLATRLEII